MSTPTAPDLAGRPQPGNEARRIPRAGAATSDARVVVEDAADPEWDRFVESQPAASAYHRSGWSRLIGRAFGHEPRLLAVRTGGGVTGVLPLVVMRSRLFGRFVVSLPYLNAGGVLAADSESANLLVDAGIELARAARAGYLELRHTRRVFPRLAERRHRVGMSLCLQDSPERQWQVLDRKIRNQVRKGEKSSLEGFEGGLELVEEFYDIFSRNMRDLGTPVFPIALFREALATFPDNTIVFCARRGGLPLASAILHHRDRWAEVIWASARREYNSLCPNVFLYWRMLQAAIRLGCRTFEFGRCAPDEGTFHFKRQWGAEPHPLVWEYWTARGALGFDASPRNPKYARAVAIWRRLPLSLTTALGPRIVRGIPC